MPKPRHRSTKIEVPINSHVTLRVQHDFPVNDEDIKRLNTIYNQTLNMLAASANELNALLNLIELGKSINQLSTQYGHLLKSLQTHFNLDLKMPIYKLCPYIRNVRGSMLKIHQGLLANDTTLFLSNTSRNSRSKLTQAGYIYNIFCDRIYVNLELLEESDETVIHTIIHEASHLFANTHDFDIYYKDETTSHLSSLLSFAFYNNNSQELKEMSSMERIQHADSLSNFVMQLISKPNSLNVQTHLTRENPGREYIYTNTNNLFSVKKKSSREEMLLSAAVSTGTAILTATALMYLLRKK